MKLTDMKNIGAKMKSKLNAIGINNAEKLSELGSKDAFFHLKTAFPEVCLVHLYALHGAINNIDFSMLPQDVKNDLKSFSDSLK
jgi:DNA transformation protein